MTDLKNLVSVLYFHLVVIMLKSCHVRCWTRRLLPRCLLIRQTFYFISINHVTALEESGYIPRSCSLSNLHGCCRIACLLFVLSVKKHSQQFAVCTVTRIIFKPLLFYSINYKPIPILIETGHQNLQLLSKISLDLEDTVCNSQETIRSRLFWWTIANVWSIVMISRCQM